MGLSKQTAADNENSSPNISTSSRYFYDTANVKVFEPGWSGKLPTAVRILPEINQKTGQILPCRTDASLSSRALTNWRMVLPVCKWVGTGGKDTSVSCVLYDPAKARSGVYDIRKNPYLVLYNRIKDLAYNPQEIRAVGRTIETGNWLSYFKGSLEKQAFSAPKNHTFMQVAFYVNRGRVSVDQHGVPAGLGDNDQTHMLMITEKAGDQLRSMVLEPTEEHRPDGKPSQFDKMFAYGDITNLETGKFVCFANPDKEEGQDFSSITGNDQDDLLISQAVREGFGKTYVVGMFEELTLRLEDRSKLRIDTDISEFEDVINSRVRNWFDEDLVKIPEDLELVEWLADAFRTTPEILEAGWAADYPEYYNTDVVQAAIKNRTQGYVPGAGDSGDDEQEDGERSSRSLRRSRRRLKSSDNEVEDEVVDLRKRRTAKKSSIYDGVTSGMDEELAKPATRQPKRKIIRKTTAKAGAKKTVRVRRKKPQ